MWTKCDGTVKKPLYVIAFVQTKYRNLLFLNNFKIYYSLKWKVTRYMFTVQILNFSHLMFF